mmetsp:Transcript_8557/g.33829  ORF Transcript_8557/g.33829 Transcript_8557/m.33829 type:complete len:202 (+) Transcript_8557:115-720(+)
MCVSLCCVWGDAESGSFPAFFAKPKDRFNPRSIPGLRAPNPGLAPAQSTKLSRNQTRTRSREPRRKAKSLRRAVARPPPGRCRAAARIQTLPAPSLRQGVLPRLLWRRQQVLNGAARSPNGPRRRVTAVWAPAALPAGAPPPQPGKALEPAHPAPTPRRRTRSTQRPPVAAAAAAGGRCARAFAVPARPGTGVGGCSGPPW